MASNDTRIVEEEDIDLGNESAVRQRIKDLEEMMRRCQSRLEALKLTLNGFKPTNRLPSEILAMIFGRCVMEGRVSFDMHTKPRWMGFTAVCQYWRSVALNTPALWTYPDYHHADLARSMIERSQPLPITVEVHISPWTTREGMLALQETFQHASRISHFKLSVRGRIDPKEYLSKHATKAAAPLLQSMEIHIAKFQHSFKIPDKIWGGKAPNLTHLSLQGCCIESKSRLLRHLTFLHLDMRNSHRPVNYKEIVNNAPHLEHLELCPGARMRDDEPTNVLHLPRLRHFHASGDMLGCTFLLNQFSFPDSTTIHIEVTFVRCESRFQADQVFMLFLSSISGIFASAQHNGAIPLKSLLVEGYDRAWMQIQAWAKPSGAIHFEERNIQPRLCLSFNHTHREHRPRWDNVLGTIVSNTFHLAIPSLECLSFRIDKDLLRTPLETILRCFHSLSVHTLEILDHPLPVIFEAMRDDTSLGRAPWRPIPTLWPEQYEEDLRNGIAFPKLRTLCLDSVELTSYTEVAPIFDSLVESLKARWKYDSQLDLAYLKECDLDDEQVALLGKVVKEYVVNSR
ncbi:hypothetical protein AAF712_005833 [Marasmius tenuissimus]|uniref:F-box domain-containing protein n=1 Tax=Marasmius tenuissimus TaxID=585030 RepID=A0ABR2ZIQ1_9AGAR